MNILLYLLPTEVQPTICKTSNHFRVFREVEFSDSRKIAKNINEIRYREIRLVGIRNRDSCGFDFFGGHDPLFRFFPVLGVKVGAGSVIEFFLKTVNAGSWWHQTVLIFAFCP